MTDQIVITEKSSQAKDLRAAVGSRYGAVLAAEGHLLDLCEPEDANPAWKCQRRRKNVPARRRKNVLRAGWELVPVVHGRDPRAGRRALRAAGGGPRVGGACGPTGPSGGLFGRLPASRSALLEPVALAVHLQDMDMVGDAVEQRAGEALAGEHRGPFLEGQV